MKDGKTIAYIIAGGLILSTVIWKGSEWLFYEKVTRNIDHALSSFDRTVPKVSVQNIKKDQYEIVKLWMPGKPLRECMIGREHIDKEVLRCRDGFYYEDYIKK